VIQQGTERIPWVVGITGASGTPYAAAVLRGLLDAGLPVDPVVSQAARLTLIDETGSTFHEAQWREDTEQFLGRDVGNMLVWKVSELVSNVQSTVCRSRAAATSPVGAPGLRRKPTPAGSHTGGAVAQVGRAAFADPRGLGPVLHGVRHEGHDDGDEDQRVAAMRQDLI
jgi:hypothetical protein